MQTRPIYLAVILLLISYCSVLAQNKGGQPSKEELKKLMDKALEDLPPEEREKMKKQLEQNMSKVQAAGSNYRETNNTKAAFFPARNTAVLNSLPKQPSSGASMQAYVKKIYTDITSKLPAAHLQEINKLAAGKKPLVLNQLAIAAYFFQNNTITGIALGARACDVPDPGPLELNNLAAMLHVTCYPQKAIPILQYLNAKYPSDAVVKNNLGQAYALLGEKEKAEEFLVAAIRIAPLHPEANNTMAHLKASENNMQKAAEYVNASLKGGYTEAAQRLEAKLPAKDRKPLILPDVDLPDAFNEYRITMPPSLITIADIPMHKATNEAWDLKLRQQQKMVMDLSSRYNKEGEEQLKRDIEIAQRNFVKNPNTAREMGRTFSYMAIQQMNRLSRNYKSPILNYSKTFDSAHKDVRVTFQKKMASLEKEYSALMKGLDCGQGPKYNGCERLMQLQKEYCLKSMEATNTYLRDEAGVLFEYRRKVLGQALREFHFKSYYGYISGMNEASARAAYYEAAEEYLQKIESLREGSVLSGSKVNWTACSPKYNETKKDIELKPKWEFECPVDGEIPFFVGKFKFNCKEASFSLGAGATFTFTQNFETQQCTLSIGIGTGKDKTIKIPGVEGKAEVSINQSIFITFDGKKKMVDVGMRFGAGVSLGYGFGGSLPGGAGLDEDGVLTPIGGPGWSKDGPEDNQLKDNIGYTISINSGFEPNITFQESALYERYFGERPINPNVRLYTK